MTPPLQATQSLNISKDSSAPKASKGDASEASLVAQIFIFKGVNFVGQDCFAQERISLGSGEHADLLLQGEGIADIQAYVYLKEGQIIISDRTANGVRINGIFQKTAMLRPLDLVDIGPYTLKIKAVSGDTAAPKQKIFQGATSPAIKSTTAKPAPKQERTVNPPQPGARPAPEASFEIAKEEAVSENFGEDSSDDFADFFQFYADPATANYDIVFYGQLRPTANPETVRMGLQRLFRAGPQQVETLFRQPRVVIKKNLSYQKAQQLKTVFEKTGAQCHLEPVDEQRLKANEFDTISAADVPSPLPLESTSAPPDKAAPTSVPRFLTPSDLASEIDAEAASETDEVPEIVPDESVRELPASTDEPEPLLEEVFEPEEISTPPTADELLLKEEPVQEPAPPKQPFAAIDDDDDEEDDDEPDCEADFKLRDKLVAARGTSPATGDTQIQVIKLRNDQVLDISYLKKRQRYTIDYKGRKFCLAENRRNNATLFYFSDHLTGRIESAGEGVVSTSRLMRDLKPWRRRKNLFRRELPNDGCVLLHDGDFEYRLSVCDLAPPIDVQLPPKEKRHPYKHAATSFLFHVVFIAFLGLMPSFNADDNNELETHFVQLDQDQFAELEKLTKPEPKKPTPPPPPKKVEPPPQPPVKKVAPVTKVKPKRVASGKKKKSSKVASVSRHPNAGGGFGKGNVVNRNVNQAGLLSMLGDSVGFQPQAAVAAVTNLDAVTAVGGVGKSNFKVGGIVGKLGSDKISVPTGGIVATSGSKQVLRSIGASGPGKVAALEKGEIGQKQVGGTVTASLTKSVLIQGGMSRQAVKRVIDQHLDEITYCYETALISNPSIMGKMIFEWKILTSGQVGEVRIKSSTVNSHEIHACIKAAIKTWQFPKPKGSTVVVSYPFIFDVVGF
jgi:hypothetical protein